MEPVEPNLTQRMLNELSPSPTTATGGWSRWRRARRMQKEYLEEGENSPAAVGAANIRRFLATTTFPW